MITLARAMAADPQGRHHPVPAAAAQPLDALCPHDAVRRPRLWPARRRRPCRLARARRQLLGPQRHHPRRRPSPTAAGLPELTGRKPFGGHVLSHDFVEAALMRRGGYAVYMLPQLAGSYEETPPSLIDLATRDRRWAQGNLQHIEDRRRQGPALGQPRAPDPGHHVLSRLAAVADAADGGPACSPPWRGTRAQLLPRRLLALPRLAGVRSRAGAAAVRHHLRRALPAEAARAHRWRCATANCARAAAASSGLLKSVLAESLHVHAALAGHDADPVARRGGCAPGPRLRLERPEPRRPGHAARPNARSKHWRCMWWRASASPCSPSTFPGRPSCGWRPIAAALVLSPLVSWGSGMPALGRRLWDWNLFRIPEEAPAHGATSRCSSRCCGEPLLEAAE